MQQGFTRDRFTWLTYLLLAFYGYFLNAIGPITPFLKDELGLSYTVSSLHYTAFAVGILLVGVGGHIVIRRLGRWRSLWIGTGGLSVGALLLVTGKSPWITIAATFLMGLVGSLILAIIPSALSDRHGEQRAIALTEANMVSSLAATSAPLLVGFFARTSGGWQVALWALALMPLIMYAAFRNTSMRETTPTTPAAPEEEKKSLPGRYWAYWWALVLGIAVEFCMISWSADYLEKVLGMLKADAAQSVSLFLGAMIIGRLVVSRLTQALPTPRLISISILVAGGGFLLFWMGGSKPAGLAGLFVTGLGVAGLYPLILSLAIGSVGSQTVQAGSRATLASGTAILTLPLVLGRLADGFGIQRAYGIVALLLVGAFVIIQAVRRDH